MKNKIIIIFSAIVFLVLSQPSHSETIRLNDGSTLEGKILEISEKGILLKSREIEVRIKREYIAIEEYVKIWSKFVRKKTAKYHLELGIFCMKNGFDDIAKRELERAVSMDPALKSKIKQERWNFSLSTLEKYYKEALKFEGENRFEKSLEYLEKIKEYKSSDTRKKFLEKSELKNVEGLDKKIESVTVKLKNSKGLVLYEGKWIPKWLAEYKKYKKKRKKELEEAWEKRKKALEKQADKYHSTWKNAWVIKTKFHKFRSNIPRKSLVKIAKALDAYYRKVQISFFKDLKKTLIRVYIFKDRKGYEKEAKKYGSVLVHSGGFCKGNLIVTNWSRRLLKVLYHEQIHQILHLRCSPKTWFDEGMACFFETTKIEKDKVKIGNMNSGYLGLVKTAMRSKSNDSLRELLSMSYNDFHKSKRRSLHYAESWSLIYYIFKKGLLQKNMKMLMAGRTDVNGLQKIFGKPIKQIEQDWIEFIAGLGS